ncbi:MAG TPA: bacterial proteasome activator family protein [Actinomycetes bacterium]|nr:bacterial proteasome activator family protein [Actinomycetes bacterium]
MSEPPEDQEVIIVGPGGQPVSRLVPGPSGILVPQPEGGEPPPEPEGNPITDVIEQPAKVMRIGSMIKQLLDEVRAAPLDEAARTRLRDIHRRSVIELEDGLSPELREELDRLALPFSQDAVPSDSELRVAQAQLVGWLEGLFHGIQTALFAQQMAARAQLEEMRRRALPPGSVPPQDEDGTGRPGQYL